MNTTRNLAPAVVPPEYLPLKRSLMDRQEDEFAALRKQDLGLRLREVLSFISLWIAGAGLALYGSTMTNALLSIAMEVFGVLTSGVALLACFMESHEGMHSILFKNKIFNYWAGLMFCLPLFLSYAATTTLHLRHHRYLGAREDPDEFRFYAKTKLGLWLLYYSRLFIAPTIYIFLIPIVGYRFATTRQRWQMIAEWIFMFSAYAIIFNVLPISVLALAWLLPSVVTGSLIGLWALTQHALTDARDPLLATRSVRTNALVSHFFINQNYHLEHHIFPEIPSYHLRRTCDVIAERLPRALVAKSYSGFMLEFIRASFKLEDRPIGYTELIGW